MASGLHISINAEKVFDLGPVSISNSILTTWIVSIVVFLLCAKIYKHFSNAKMTQKPSRFQSLIEMIIESLFNLVQGIAGDNKKARIFFPLISTFFLFILLSNWSGLIPGVGTIGFREVEKEETHSEETVSIEAHKEALPQEITTHQAEEKKAVEENSHDAAVENAVESVATTAAATTHDETSSEHGAFVPYFRGPTADLNTTLALAVFAMISVQVAGFKFLGFHYSSKFFNFKGPIDFFVGILELSSEFSKIISFAFRLFGNIFAGEVLLTVMAFLMPLFGPIPFLGLEVFVGLVQALVFSMLALVFMNLATMGHGESH